MSSRHLIIALVAVVVAVLIAVAYADDDQKSEVATLKGEIVDLGCYTGHGAKGEDHASCAARCIAGGMPMGLLTSTNTLYVLTMSHDDADPYNNAKKMAASIVEITGPVHERNGTKTIEVVKIKELKAVAAGQKSKG